MKSVTKEEFNLLSQFVFEKSGILLDDTKYYLIESRLGPLLAEFNCVNYKELYIKAKNNQKNIQDRLIDSISTHETYFFRDESTFEILKNKILPDYIEKHKTSHQNSRTLKIWSAACSTGQESYSIAMVLKEIKTDLNSLKLKILGTDIADSAIEKAREGMYNRIEITRGLSVNRMTRYFDQIEYNWKVSEDLRTMTDFQKVNLNGPTAHLGTFDIIFCRNVAIYFSPENRAILFDKIANQLNEGGLLVLGLTESLIGINERFEKLSPDQNAYYRLK